MVKGSCLPVSGFKGIEISFLCECGPNETSMHVFVEHTRYDQVRRWMMTKGVLDENERKIDVIISYV